MAIPIWMTDPSVCAAFSVGTPVVSLAALRALRTFLDGLHPTARCDKPSGSTSPCSLQMQPRSRTNQRPAGLFCDQLPMPLPLAADRAAELKRVIVELLLSVARDDVEATRGGECDE